MTEEKYPYGHPFWMDKPERSNLLSMWSGCMEDKFQAGHVFKNGIKGTPCHSDSYMTVVDYTNLEATFNILNEEYHLTKEEWFPHVERWITNVNTQPPFMLVAFEICRKVGIDPDPLVKQREENKKIRA